MTCVQAYPNLPPCGASACGRTPSGQKEENMEKEKKSHAPNEEKLSLHAARFLFSDCLAQLTTQKQIETICNVLVGACEENKGVIPLLPMLKRRFSDGCKPNYREGLMHLYDVIQKQERPGAPNFAIDLKIAFLKEILEGWRWWRDDKQMKTETDAEECLKFVCKSYLAGTSKLKTCIVALFHEYFDGHGDRDPTPWLNKEYLPAEIQITLIQKRARQNPIFAAREIEFCEAFDLHNRSETAVKVADNFLRRLRKMDEAIEELENKIRDVAQEKQFGHIKVKYFFRPDVIEFLITLEEMYSHHERQDIGDLFKRECKIIINRFSPPLNFEITLA